MVNVICRRQSLRLKGYDYSRSGAYFVTICAKDRSCLFGEVVHGKMRLNAVGQMVQSIWDELPRHYPHVDIDAFVVMPNHIHGIIWIVGAGPRACPNHHVGQPQGVAPTTMTLPDVVHRFKSLTTTRYHYGVSRNGWPSFHGKLWQRNYYEHIIRHEKELHRIREYIMNNPLFWEQDENNPVNVKHHPNPPSGGSGFIRGSMPFR